MNNQTQMIEVKPENQEEAKPANKKVMLINFTIITVICVGLLIYMINVDGIENIINTLKHVDYKWVLGGLICLLIYWFCDALNLHIPIKKIYKDQPLTNSIKVGMIGLLFNNITPFATGGQPMQAYELTKTGKRVSDSISVLAIKFVVTQTAIVISTIIVALFQLSFFISMMKHYLWVTILGFSINVVAIVGVILLGINKNIISKIMEVIIKILAKIHIIKNPDRKIEKINRSIDNFSEQFQTMKSEKTMVLKMYIIATIQSLAYYSITFMVYKAFGNTGLNLWQIIPIQAFLLLIMMFIPTPGSGLGAEGGFLLLFNSVFKEGTINMSILFWRIYTFYLQILVGAFFLIPTKSKITKRTIDEDV